MWLKDKLALDGIESLNLEYPFEVGLIDSMLREAARQRVIFLARGKDTQGKNTAGRKDADVNIFVTDNPFFLRNGKVDGDTIYSLTAQATGQLCLLYEAPSTFVDHQLKAIYGLESPIWVDLEHRIKAPNRIVHQPMEGNDSWNGFPSERTLRAYRRRAKARAGITVVEATTVVPEPRARLNQLIADEKHSKGINKLTEVFKEINPDTLLFYQLTHSGQISDPKFSKIVRVYESKGFDNTPGKLLSTQDIDGIIETFIQGAKIVYKSGADGVDIKLCHGYLGGQMLRPVNTRNDEYGGSLENRMRFAKRVIEGVKERISDPKFKVMVRFSIYEGEDPETNKPFPGGIGTTGPNSTEYSLEEPLTMLQLLVGYSVDILNITAGIPKYNGDQNVRPLKLPKGFEPENPITYTRYHHLDYAKQVKELNLGVPIIASGFSLFGKNIAQVGMNSILHNYTDMSGIGRQTLVDPNIDMILSGKANYCIRCKGCSELLIAQMPVGCTHYNGIYRGILEATRLHYTAPWRKTKR